VRTLYLILYLIAAILFAIAALMPTPNPPFSRFNLVAAGLFAWVLVDVIQQADRLG
jgi:hypothetical protein